jgi:multiple sugar transport system substrate-binding protein
MLPEQREVLDEIIVKIRAGRIRRRTFLERAMVAGLSSSAAISLLEACGGSSNSQGGNGAAKSLVWQSENDSTPTYKNLVDTFNKTTGQQKGIHVTWNNGPTGGGDELLTKDGRLIFLHHRRRSRASGRWCTGERGVRHPREAQAHKDIYDSEIL